MQDNTISDKIKQYKARQCNIIQYKRIECNTIQDNTIQDKTTQGNIKLQERHGKWKCGR